QLKLRADATVKEGYRIEPDPTRGGGLFALNVLDGKIVWKVPAPQCGQRARCSPAQSAAITVIPGVVFSGAIDGHLRAHATASGDLLWDIDTVQDFTTTNGVKARGGSIDVAGPVVAGGDGVVFCGVGLSGR